jgi:hypothetical protein
MTSSPGRAMSCILTTTWSIPNPFWNPAPTVWPASAATSTRLRSVRRAKSRKQSLYPPVFGRDAAERR